MHRATSSSAINSKTGRESNEHLLASSRPPTWLAPFLLLRRDHPDPVMIHRSAQQGQRLDVAGLNEIIVLVDRSETLLTEVGLNTWRKGLEGPPHSHDAKEQIFYVTAGSGLVIVGSARYAVKRGSLIYVPPRIVHQTIVTGDTPLTYLLFNAFLDASKEGHASFAEHIEKVKHLRKHQAESGRADLAETGANSIASRSGKHVQLTVVSASADTRALLLNRSDTCRTEVARVVCRPGTRTAELTDMDAERTFFVLEGRGHITVGSQTAELQPHDVVFVPWRVPHCIAAADSPVVYLCFRTRVANVAKGA